MERGLSRPPFLFELTSGLLWASGRESVSQTDGICDNTSVNSAISSQSPCSGMHMGCIGSQIINR